METAGSPYVDGDDARFGDRSRTHVLMITNHGMHDWNVVPGLPDTGGQNVYVNQFTEALVRQGYRVTIANRGGYRHPKTGEWRRGVVYHPGGCARIIYLEDGRPEFVRKEDIDEQIPALVEDLARKIEPDGDRCDLIISHYWDAAKIGVLFNRRGADGEHVPHIWVPHSLGALKKRNMDPSTWQRLRIDERIAHEKALLEELDGAVATSSAIRDTFRRDYGYEAKYFLPPCIDEERFRLLDAYETEGIWSFLAEVGRLSEDQLRSKRFITEISRTDQTKRKDVLVRAFAQVRQAVPDAMLLVSIDPHAESLHDTLIRLIADLGLGRDVIVLGSVWDQLPLLYNITSVYCTPSVMEGFGMTAQEAAACGKPVVASDLVPFVHEYLIGEHAERVPLDGQVLTFGRGGVVVPADYVDGFAYALIRLLQNEEQRHHMGALARDITIPYFTWQHMSRKLLDELGVSPEREAQHG